MLRATAHLLLPSGETDVHKLWFTLLLCGMQLEAQDAVQKVVALDAFHNNESKMPDHYQWDGVRPGGFAELGKLLAASGARLVTIRQRITRSALAGVRVFIIVDPAPPAETTDP